MPCAALVAIIFLAKFPSISVLVKSSAFFKSVMVMLFSKITLYIIFSSVNRDLYVFIALRKVFSSSHIDRKFWIARSANQAIENAIIKQTVISDTKTRRLTIISLSHLTLSEPWLFNLDLLNEFLQRRRAFASSIARQQWLPRLKCWSND